ncbi:MAG TPA: cytochrome c oxidase subunit II [Acidimicrobiales bacterium]|jgi:cytochrome c oxidase subunit 2|nr:cytochrome c oxidase subunit II [Acidimicrobiales bacterium]
MTGRARTSFAKASALALGLVLFAAGCASNAPQDTLKPEGPQAKQIDNLAMPVFYIAIFVGIAVMVVTLLVARKFRERKDDTGDEFPAQVHGNFKAEIAWTIAPAVLLACVAVPTVFTVFDLAKKPSAEALTVEVYGQQWWWEYRYNFDVDGDGEVDQIITANDLVVPTDRPIALRIMSRDVIHSWWAPALNGKKDAVPGRVHPLTIEAPEAKEYIGQCTEFCGLSHAEMRIKVVGMTPDDFQAWAEKQIVPFKAPDAEDEAALAGWSTFASQCTSCHRITGMTDPSDPGSGKLFEYPPVVNQVAGEVPNLTKLMTRTTFAGAKFDLRLDTKECVALGENWAETDEGIKKCFNREQFEAWLRDAPAEKAMHPGDAPSPESRGMNNFNLTEDQIDDLVAFFITLQ